MPESEQPGLLRRLTRCLPAGYDFKANVSSPWGKLIYSSDLNITCCNEQSSCSYMSRGGPPTLVGNCTLSPGFKTGRCPLSDFSWEMVLYPKGANWDATLFNGIPGKLYFISDV